MAAEGNVSGKNLVQTIVEHLTFRERFNQILTAINQEQLTYIAFILQSVRE